jgi:Fe-S cluster assembly ATP-binding protein
MAQQPDLVLLDEPESGVDLENIVLIGETIKKILGRTPTKALACRSLKEEKSEKKKSGLIITHTGHILRYVPADKGRILYKGRMCVGGNPFEILEQISQYGYQECIRCLNGEQNMI